ncbi:phage tail assembly protein [Bradyrhizobium neotropicale]|uniref:phage tail assembly protein n=1 Tax=Bradyrhizobium neotropicale TaxID=1497615 RepID=UPI001AD78C7F|nr:phage tail assembly protein [Bradyrhizobium neotropicale]MBO4220818.1 hypothetical protein [Bradyrhizobium neotropicale]
MNRHSREGFIDDRPMVDVTPERDDKPAERKLRPTPRPEIEPSPAEATEVAAEEEWPITVKLLHRPVKGNKGERLKEVSLREPRAGDINRYGNPIRINQDGDVLIDERKMTYMIAALTGILPPFIEDMDPRDWNSCAYPLRRFFLPDPAVWQAARTISSSTATAWRAGTTSAPRSSLRCRSPTSRCIWRERRSVTACSNRR